MLHALALLATSVAAEPTQDIYIPPAPSRFEKSSVLPGLPFVMVDALGNGKGLAQQTARAKGLQGRIMWIDGTANLVRVGSEQKIVELVARIKESGFNTIVFDVKPISGQVLYKSKIAPKILKWKDQTLDADFDPLPFMAREARKHGLPLFVSLNAFSEGHSLFREGPGYEKIGWQTMVYEPYPIVRAGDEEDQWRRLHPTMNEIPPPDMISVFTDQRRLPSPRADLFVVSIQEDGTVVDGFLQGGTVEGVPTVPAGGALLAGIGPSAEFMKEHMRPGEKVRFDTIAKFARIGDRPELQYPLMMNPNHPEVREYELSILREILTNYDVDGILYDDRLRYAGIYADFSPLTTSLFEEYVGKKLLWPDDVFKLTINMRLQQGIQPGPYYDAWMTWRAMVMRNWVSLVEQTVRNTKPGAQFGIYAGSWYGEYPKFGTNYGAPNLNAGFWYLTRQYAKTGFAPKLDMLITGCYYPTATIYEALVEAKDMARTVEFAGQMSNAVARDQTWTYAGIALNQFKNNPEGLGRALQAACASTQGVMVFDLSHDIDPMWPVFKRAFSVPRRAPHSVVGLLEEVRKKRQRYDELGVEPPAVPIGAGGAGTGH